MLVKMSATVAGVTAERWAPREVRMSAEPEVEVEALLPCLQMRRPQPEARMADVVETLKVLWPSPPVPTMSTCLCCQWGCV